MSLEDYIVSLPPSAIIATLKCPSAPKATISRPYLSLIAGVLEELDIQLQVEDIDRGLLLFWQGEEDFNKTATTLRSLGGQLRGSSWEKGSVPWRVSLLKPTGQAEAGRFLDECRTIALALFGPDCAPEIMGITLSFRVPATIKFFDTLRRFHYGL